jgi:hypothetical protein
MSEVFEAPFSMTAGEALIIAAAMRYTDEHSTARTDQVRTLEERLLKFIASTWPDDKMDTPKSQKET